MKAAPECWDCFAHSFSRIVRKAVPDFRTEERVIRESASIVGRYFGREAPCDIGTRLNLNILKFNPDPFRKEKREAKKTALALYRELDRKTISLDFALKAALLGNILDFVVKGWDHRDHDIRKLISMPIALNHARHLEREIGQARTVLVLPDNAGEVILDAFLLRYLREKGKTVVLSPKSAPIQNDATIEDIRGTPVEGLYHRLVPTARAVGLDLEQSSPSFRKVFRESDLVIMKGMGYFENAFDVPANSFFILKAKCRPVARELGVSVGDNAVVGRKFFGRKP